MRTEEIDDTVINSNLLRFTVCIDTASRRQQSLGQPANWEDGQTRTDLC